jgi:hypothetical protein
VTVFGPQLAGIVANAALPQKIVMLLLALATPAALVGAARERRGGARRSILVSELRVAGPALGLLVGALNAFHMMQTALRLPIAATSKDLAPGIMEIAVLVGLGALAGLAGAALNGLVERRARG